MATAASRFLLLMLPKPSAGADNLPREKPLPPPALAVSITQAAPPDACPDVPTMIAGLPDDIRALIDKRPVA